MNEPYFEMENGKLYCGDCVEILPEFKRNSVDAVITDPPYMIGASSTFDEKSKAGKWADLDNMAWWYSMWFSQCKRILKNTGYLIVCGNWRSLPVYIKAHAIAEMPVVSCMVWDKEWIGTSADNALRPTYEMLTFSPMPDGQIPNRSASDIFRLKWQTVHSKESDHSAEKPIDLMFHVMELVTKQGDLILDPFLGSGTTAIACERAKRKWIGIEKDKKNCAMAKKRIIGKVSQLAIAEYGEMD